MSRYRLSEMERRLREADERLGRFEADLLANPYRTREAWIDSLAPLAFGLPAFQAQPVYTSPTSGPSGTYSLVDAYAETQLGTLSSTPYTVTPSGTGTVYLCVLVSGGNRFASTQRVDTGTSTFTIWYTVTKNADPNLWTLKAEARTAPAGTQAWYKPVGSTRDLYPFENVASLPNESLAVADTQLINATVYPSDYRSTPTNKWTFDFTGTTMAGYAYQGSTSPVVRIYYNL